MKNCPFCSEEITDAESIYKTDQVNVLYSLRPGKNKGRCFVAPKRHVETLGELSLKEAEHLFGVVWEVSNKLRDYLKPKGMNYGFNEGAIAGQSVKHFHFHIIPRYEYDGMSEYHLFHRPDVDKMNLTREEMAPYIKEFRNVLN
jgi:histidine triad (HIT) family protein